MEHFKLRSCLCLFLSRNDTFVFYPFVPYKITQKQKNIITHRSAGTKVPTRTGWWMQRVEDRRGVLLESGSGPSPLAGQREHVAQGLVHIQRTIILLHMLDLVHPLVFNLAASAFLHRLPEKHVCAMPFLSEKMKVSKMQLQAKKIKAPPHQHHFLPAFSVQMEAKANALSHWFNHKPARVCRVYGGLCICFCTGADFSSKNFFRKRIFLCVVLGWMGVNLQQALRGVGHLPTSFAGRLYRSAGSTTAVTTYVFVPFSCFCISIQFCCVCHTLRRF